MKRILLVASAAALTLSACGSSGSSGGAATSAAAGTATTVASAVGATTTAAAAKAGGPEIDMKEWAITAPALKAGAATLTVKNNGNNPHELKVIKAASFAALPKDANGGVDESKLDASAIVAKTDRIGGGSSASLAVTLEAGTYVFVCNLGNGSNNHAAKGQHADVTVS